MIHFELVTPERVVFRQDVDAVTLPTTEGEITILPGHAALVAALVAGVARLKKENAEEDVAVSGGFIEVNAGDSVRVLADTAERGAELQLATIEEAKTRAETVMKEAVRADDAQYALAAASLERELARYKIARKHAGRGAPTFDKSTLPTDENPV
jgi:F-type H+-transporting ATPase subunit epsilon